MWNVRTRPGCLWRARRVTSFGRVMVVLPTPEPSSNNIGLVDWSPKGHRLLITEGRWGYDSDFGETTIRIYDADSNKLSSESFVQEAFRKHAGKDCLGVFQAVGFSEDGGIIVRAGPYFDEVRNSRRRTPAWLKRACGFLLLRMTQSGRFRTTTNQNIMVMKCRASLLNQRNAAS
jgi:hypothetical protein